MAIPSTNRPLSPSDYSKRTDERLVQPFVVVPPSPPSVSHHKPNDQGPIKKRKLNYDGEASASVLRLKDQKEEADIALQKLQDLLHEIFEAEDRLEPDTFVIPTAQGLNAFFRFPYALELHGAILTTESHNRLQKALQKVARFHRLNDLPSEYLTRVQKLCEGPIISVQALNLALSDPTNELETQSWLRKVDDLHTSLLAIGTLLQTMFGRRSEKELCPEDLIQAIPTALNQLFDHCVIPAVEARPMDKDSQLFDFFTKEKKTIGILTHLAKKLLNLLANFLSRIDVSEGVITSTEFLAAKLIFVENAHSDKESTVGYQKYESVRRAAMDVLAQIFSKYPSQRPYILDEILVSLEKLPSTRQNARQFKLIDGKNIQLLTALVIQLVQTTALDSPKSRFSKSKRRLPLPGYVDDHQEDGLGRDYKEEEESDSNDEDDVNSKLSLERLASRVDRLYDDAVRSAQYIIKFIVTRAMTSTKTGDQPYRNLLDLFTEDLISVLGSTDWPAAELLLRILASHMVGITEQDKSPAIAKNMALELLGWMGSAISDLSAAAQHLIPGIDETRNELTDYLRQLYDEHSRQALHIQDLIASDGPYRITMEYLQNRDLDDWQLTSARGYYLVSWAKMICLTYYDAGDKNSATNSIDLSKLLTLMTELFSDSRWLETNK
jgi:cohesin loading factor subunit SCC2